MWVRPPDLILNHDQPPPTREKTHNTQKTHKLDDSDLLKPAAAQTHLLAWLWLFLCSLFNWK